MDREVAFKSGKDLEAGAPAAVGTIACESCGRRAERVAAKDLGWQVGPPVCPDCLRWSATARESQIGDRKPEVRIEPRGRYWAVFEGGTLLCLTVYRKGAVEVKRRLEAERR